MELKTKIVQKNGIDVKTIDAGWGEDEVKALNGLLRKEVKRFLNGRLDQGREIVSYAEILTHLCKMATSVEQAVTITAAVPQRTIEVLLREVLIERLKLTGLVGVKRTNKDIPN